MILCNVPDLAYRETYLIVRTVDLALPSFGTHVELNRLPSISYHTLFNVVRSSDYPLPNKIMLATRRLTLGYRKLLPRSSFFSSSALNMVYVPSYLFG